MNIEWWSLEKNSRKVGAEGRELKETLHIFSRNLCVV